MLGALACTSVLADKDVPSQSQVDVCKDISGTATSVMQARQNGVPIVEMMDIAGDSELLRYIVMQAYEGPRYSTEPHKKRAEVEFSNRMFLECAKYRKE